MKVCEGSETQDEGDGGAGRVLTYRIHDLPDQGVAWSRSTNTLGSQWNPWTILWESGRPKFSSDVWENGNSNERLVECRALQD
ncbi:hypothetical protein C1H46_029009 [Malus baccata]|uniref:Uncharacterized protein n=1 Tax=Malus baccata TaxID=106549 RepID=A0A540LGL1_MALBA|nr:hypothetical protein C1H46_029009 [Malus baccata]